MKSTLLLFLTVSVMAGCDRPPADPGGQTPAPASSAGASPGGGDDATPAEPPGEPGSKDTTGGEAPASQPTPDRVPMVAPDHAYHKRLEGTASNNACKADSDCHKGGCSGEVCSAEQDLITTCEALPVKWPAGSDCGCIEAACQWWNPAGTVLRGKRGGRPKNADDRPREGAECGGKRCKPGEECIRYTGIGGRQQFRDCGIRCRPNAPNRGCPTGMRCVNIADGPGPVCRK